MKKTIFILTFLITSFAFAQDKPVDTAFLYVVKDDLEGTQFFTPSYDMVIANNERTEGAKLSMHLKTDGSFSFITAKLIGLGNCVEDSELIILFSNSEKMSIKSWNKFNCKGNAYFSLSKKQELLLSTQELKTIRIRNGETYKSVTSSDFSNPRYYIQLFSAIKSKSYTLLEE